MHLCHAPPCARIPRSLSADAHAGLQPPCVPSFGACASWHKAAPPATGSSELPALNRRTVSTTAGTPLLAASEGCWVALGSVRSHRGACQYWTAHRQAIACQQAQEANPGTDKALFTSCKPAGTLAGPPCGEAAGAGARHHARVPASNARNARQREYSRQAHR